MSRTLRWFRHTSVNAPSWAHGRRRGPDEVHAAAGLRPTEVATEFIGAWPSEEGKELLAGYQIVDVESPERAIEIAAEASAAPGPGGKPIKTPIEVRELMGAPTSDE